MVMWTACLWGLLGASFVEGWDLYTAIHTAKDFPWKQEGRLKLAPYSVAAAIRLGIGAGLAAVLADSGQVAGAVGFVAVGIAAPKILQQLARQGQAIALSQPMLNQGQAAAEVPAAEGSLAQSRDLASEGGAVDAR